MNNNIKPSYPLLVKKMGIPKISALKELNFHRNQIVVSCFDMEKGIKMNLKWYRSFMSFYIGRIPVYMAEDVLAIMKDKLKSSGHEVHADDVSRIFI